MHKTFKIHSLLLLLVLLMSPSGGIAGLTEDNESLDPVYTRGVTAEKIPSHLAVNEFVNPFSGNATLVHTDIFLPGDGGLDLEVVRSYNSGRIWGGVNNNNLVGVYDRSPIGLGWSMHMGIVRNPAGTGSSSNFFPNNPVVEMPDGSQHVMFKVPGTTNKFKSKDNWVYEYICDGISCYGIWELKLPDGTKYTFENNDNAGYLTAHTNGVQIAQATKIEHPNGAVITISYDKDLSYSYSYLQTIQAGSRTVSFVYNKPSHRLTQIKLNGSTFFNYYYTTLNSVDLLSEAKPPTGSSWKYTYHQSGTSMYQAKRATYPYGGYVEYNYSSINFNTGSLSLPFSVVTTKWTNDGVNTTGTWTYSYNNSVSSTEVKTIINGPDNLKEEHTYVGWNGATSGNVWRVGLATKKKVIENSSTILTEDYAWNKSSNSISNDTHCNPDWRGFGTICDYGIYFPLLSSKTATRDGRTYTTNYSGYDSYGNPGSISESGEQTRTTSLGNYLINTTKNIVKGKPRNVTVSGVGTNFTGSYATSYSYDSNNGNVLQITKNGIPTDYLYYSNGNVWKKTQADGNTTTGDETTTYTWQNGRVSQVSTADYTLKRTINSNGTVQKETNGRTPESWTNYLYDTNLRLKKITPPVGNVTDITYTSSNRVESRGGYVVTHNYDGYGRVISTIDPRGITSTTTYKKSGYRDFTDSNVGDKVIYDYFGRVKERIHKDNTTITYDYNSLGNGKVVITDEENHTTTLDYDSFGDPDEKFLVSVTDGEGKVTNYIYNILGSLTSISQGGLTRSFAFDGTKNWLNSESHPDKGTTTYSARYAFGNLKDKVDSLGTTTYNYDSVNRVKSITNTDGTVSITYDGPDLVKTLTNPSSSITYSYDTADRLDMKDETINALLFSTDYAYDGNDNLKHIYYPSGRHIEYTYDLTKNQVTSIIDHGINDLNGFGSIVQNIMYGTGVNAGQLKNFTYSNGLTTYLGYNSRNLVTAIDVPVNLVLDMDYTYYNRGNLWTLSDNLDPSKNQDFTYDAVNRLLTFDGSWGQGDFAYYPDGLGNRSTKTVAGIGTTYNYTGNKLTSTTGGEPSVYGYNGDGELNYVEVGGQGYDVVYDKFHNVIRYESSGTPLAEFEYNGDGKRVIKTEGGATTVYHYGQGGNVLSETDENGSPVADYVYLYGKLVAKITPLLIPDISVVPASHDFGNVDSGTTTPAQVFTVSSVGTGNLVIGTVSLTGASASEYVIQADNCSNQTLPPSSNCTVDVAFSPTSSGPKSAFLSIPSNDPDTPVNDVQLSGIGVQYLMIVTKTGTGAGTVTSTDGFISCDPDCREVYNPGTVVTLTATTDAESSFVGWSGGGCSGTGSCIVTMNADTTITATFDILPPVADFTGAPTTGGGPMLVNFTDASLRATSWLWDFGDNTTSTDQNPSHVYSDAGTYSVTLTATNSSGSDPITKTDYITVQACSNNPVRIDGATPVYYATLQAAYDAAQSGDTIQSQAISLTGSLVTGQAKTVTFAGGYDCGYTTVIGKTIVIGNVDVNAGTATMGNMIVD